MNPMTQKPENMGRVLLTDKDGVTLQFGMYKDGMYRTDGSAQWHTPEHWGGWMSIKDVKETLSHTVERINKYGQHQFNRGILKLDVVTFESWKDTKK